MKTIWKQLVAAGTLLGCAITPSLAGDKTAGGLIGAAAGTAVGASVGGDRGALIGAVAGAAIGVAIADQSHRHDSGYRNDVRYGYNGNRPVQYSPQYSARHSHSVYTAYGNHAAHPYRSVTRVNVKQPAHCQHSQHRHDGHHH
jgi:hypothetical protein